MSDLGELIPIARRLCGGEAGSLVQVHGGGNNRVYRVQGGNGRAYALKTYYAASGDGLRRLEAEYGGLQFLWNQGVRCVPEPVAIAAADRCALFAWVDGGRAVTAEDADIEAAVLFLRTLHELSRRPTASELLPAREACLSAEELMQQLHLRRGRLMARAPFHGGLAEFLRTEFDPALIAVTLDVQRAHEKAEIPMTRELPAEDCTLSPSDFGFHNAVRRPDGTLTFVDFEYFGWDDPVKLVSDFLLHPGMILSDAQRRRFAIGAQAVFGSEPSYAWRLHQLYPVYALRWAMIVLNEFLPDQWRRRAFAKGEQERNQVLALQLEKARRFVRIAREKEFAYGSPSYAS
jgi:hypothetical protein